MRRIAVMTAVMLALSATTRGDTVPFTVFLDGSQEAPPNASPATGSGALTLDTVTNNVHFDISFSGLLAPQTAAHLHQAAFGVSGPVVVPLPMGSPIVFDSVVSDSVEAAMLAGNTYVNVHSTVFPGGEIRGQVELVPEPATIGLLGSAALVLVGLRRRRRMA
jgi:hypothetical protein